MTVRMIYINAASSLSVNQRLSSRSVILFGDLHGECLEQRNMNLSAFLKLVIMSDACT